jgi:hypothetical protein
MTMSINKFRGGSRIVVKSENEYLQSGVVFDYMAILMKDVCGSWIFSDMVKGCSTYLRYESSNL